MRRTVQAVVDPLIAMAAVVIALWLRFESSMPTESTGAIWWLVALVGVCQLLAGWSQGLYVGRWRFGGFEEVFALVRATLLASTVLLAVNLPLNPRPMPLSACVAQPLLTIVMCASVRWAWRLVHERTMRPAGADLARAVVVGAGDAGSQLVSSMMRNRNGRYLPVGLVDDDPSKRFLRLSGVPVLGPTSRLCEVAAEVDAVAVIIAVPSADGELIRELAGRASGCGLRVLVLPPVQELLDGVAHDSDVRPISEADLLGRRQIDTDVEAIAGYVTGRRVLVTGAGGSIGSELCRQLHRFVPDSLVMLDRDESALHSVQLSLEGRALLDDRRLVVADIRDADRLDTVFAEHRPEVVFHAAALKHLPLLEMHPIEAYRSNCLGTQNVLDVSVRHGVERFVNISTDKAADPTSVLGASKRVAERLTAATDQVADGDYVSVRFGNVLGSRGSVLTAFRAQIDAGGPVTVTDPDVTRYFMTVEEAVQLVIQAGAIGRHGNAMVLDMGTPVRIDDVARRLVEQARRPISVVYTGLRPGEKLHEVLLGADEEPVPSDHPLISCVRVPLLPIDEVAVLDRRMDDRELAAALLALAIDSRDHSGRTSA